MDDVIVTELNARADAALKVALAAIDMTMSVASVMKMTVDLNSYAAALENSEAVDGLSAADFEIERRARKRAATILRDIATRIAASTV